MGSLGEQSGATLSYLVSRYPSRVAYNESRNAIQLYGCDAEGVVAQVILGREQMIAFIDR